MLRAKSGAALIALLIAGLNPASALERPRLILQVTVDQLRGDLPWRYYDRLGKGGFRFLLDEGTVFADAHHGHANTETIVGHTTLATGAHPAAHGMIGNLWFDRETGKQVYNIEDPNHRLLTAGAGVDTQTEIDPTQKVASTDGRSPAAILVSTFSDELALNTAGRAKIFGVSIKDRGAVSMAGHAGKAFWFSKATGEWVTSGYYYDRYPEWVTAFNKAIPTQRYAQESWELLHDRSSYLFGDADDQPWETALPGYGRVFPHPFGDAGSKLFTTLLTISPAGDDMTLAFAKALVINEQLGRDDVTDYLAVSFSSTDYVGHVFGPSSLESEDNILRLDRTLGELFSFIDEQIGLEKTLIVLSADHGAPEAPGYLKSLGIPGGYVHPDRWEKTSAFQTLKKKFGIGQELIQNYVHPYLYLNSKVIQDKDLDKAALERAVAAELVKFPDVALAVSSTAMREGNLPDTPIHRAILNNFNPSRSGDIFVVFAPNRFINDFDGLDVAVTHGSPWGYDTYVPILFGGYGVPAQRIVRRVETIDIAPTLAAIAHVKPPSGATGRVLTEALPR
jgi:predicted AlkP superfamily pyrophosphatase or phosphodiesterase